MINWPELHRYYKLLTKYNSLMLDHFGDDSLSDDDYFKCGIYFDIVNNALSVIINLIQNNYETKGIDNNCRIIIEAFAILQMDEKGKVGIENKKMYRLNYTSVELDNLKGVKGFDEALKTMKRSRNRFFVLARRHLKCNDDKLDKCSNKNDPYFYLLNKPYENISYFNLLTKNGINIDKGTGVYSFFSYMVHPRYESDPLVETLTHAKRLEYVFELLDKVCAYLEEKMPKIDYSDVPEFEEVFTERPNLKNVLENVSVACDNFGNLIRDYLGNFIIFAFKEMKSLLVDMILCIYLNHFEMVTPKYKSFVELFSVLCYLSEKKDPNDRKYLTEGFLAASRIQLEKLLDMIDDEHFKNTIHVNLHEYYDNYFTKMKSSFSDYDDFESKVSSKNLAIFGDDFPGYKGFVEIVSSEYIDNPKEINILYDVALDLDHSTGYSFNMSGGVWEYFGAMAIPCCLSYIYEYTSRLKLNATDPKYEKYYQQSKKAIKNLQDFFDKSRRDIQEKYKVHMDEPEGSNIEC